MAKLLREMDMGGPTTNPPIVDNDELWIASALGGSRNNTFKGLLDEVAIHREALPAKAIAGRYKRIPQPKPIYTTDDWPVIMCRLNWLKVKFRELARQIGFLKRSTKLIY